MSHYPNKTEGKAVFFSPSARKSFYFEPEGLKWNFSYHGGDPNSRHVLNGTFYYHSDFFGQSPEHPIGADFCAVAEREGDVLYARITFYRPGSGNDPLGVFFARDVENHLAGFEGRAERLPGNWNIVHGDKLEDKLRKKYQGREAPADALFYNSNVGQLPSLHLTVNELGWAFLHNLNLSTERGLAGLFFYSNEEFFDREDEDPIIAGFFVEQREEDGKHYVLIKFYMPSAGNVEPFLAEFLAADPDDKSKDILGEHTGEWKPLPGPDLEADLRRKYRREEAADALFLRGSGASLWKSFRLAVSDRGWEFWDNTLTIGHRTMGSLFFDDLMFRSDETGPICTAYYIERKRGKLGHYALVTFYAPESTHVVWGEYIGLDPINRASEAQLLKKDLYGEWRKADYNFFTARASKQKDSTKITLSILGSVAEMECKREDKIYGEEFNVKGGLTTKTLGNYGDFVRWHKDRAIFHESPTAEDFTAYFFPQDVEVTVGSQDDLGMDVTWKPKPNA